MYQKQLADAGFEYGSSRIEFWWRRLFSPKKEIVDFNLEFII